MAIIKTWRLRRDRGKALLTRHLERMHASSPPGRNWHFEVITRHTRRSV